MDEIQKENTDIKICFIDAFTIKSEEEFYQTFAREVIKANSKKWQRRQNVTYHTQGQANPVQTGGRCSAPIRNP